MTELLRVSGALCRIGRNKVLQIDHFGISVGEHWCLFGPNGAGKTLLANLIAGKRIESGSYVSCRAGFDPALDVHIVSFEEQQRLWERDNRLDISEYSADARDPGTLVDSLIRTARGAGEQDEALLRELVQSLDLAALLDKGIRFLSSGQVRRVLIARALFARRGEAPQLLILDDPLESIDRRSRQRIAGCIEQQLHRGLTSLQLCRREEDILPGITHMAVLQDLKLSVAGPAAVIRESAPFLTVCEASPVLPELLPAAPDPGQESWQGPLIRLEKVSASYGELEVLRDIDWTMERGHHVLIEGPNGCGKSTLLSLIDGENHKAYGQEVYLFGNRKGSGESVWDIKARFGIVSNELHNKYVKGWKVLDVVVSGFYDSVGLYDDSGASEVELAGKWLAALGIAGLAKSYYHEISFGQQRLVLLARAMVKNPLVLILDEPCVGLDNYHRRLILGVLDRVAQQTRTCIVYVSHVAGEQPACINRKLSFVPDDAGGYRLLQQAI